MVRVRIHSIFIIGGPGCSEGSAATMPLSCIVDLLLSDLIDRHRLHITHRLQSSDAIDSFQSSWNICLREILELSRNLGQLFLTKNPGFNLFSELFRLIVWVVVIWVLFLVCYVTFFNVSEDLFDCVLVYLFLAITRSTGQWVEGLVVDGALVATL